MMSDHRQGESLLVLKYFLYVIVLVCYSRPPEVALVHRLSNNPLLLARTLPIQPAAAQLLRPTHQSVCLSFEVKVQVTGLPPDLCGVVTSTAEAIVHTGDLAGEAGGEAHAARGRTLLARPPAGRSRPPLGRRVAPPNGAVLLDAERLPVDVFTGRDPARLQRGGRPVEERGRRAGHGGGGDLDLDLSGGRGGRVKEAGRAFIKHKARPR